MTQVMQVILCSRDLTCIDIISNRQYLFSVQCAISIQFWILTNLTGGTRPAGSADAGETIHPINTRPSIVTCSIVTVGDICINYITQISDITQIPDSYRKLSSVGVIVSCGTCITCTLQIHCVKLCKSCVKLCTIWTTQPSCVVHIVHNFTQRICSVKASNYYMKYQMRTSRARSPTSHNTVDVTGPGSSTVLDALCMSLIFLPFW